MRAEKIDEQGHAARAELAIGIEQEHILAAHGRDRAVDCARKTVIVVRSDALNAVRDQLERAVGRRVVIDHDVVR